MITLPCTTPNGERVELSYDPHTSELLYPDGTPVFEYEAPATPHGSVHRISPDDPGRKSRSPDVLKIQLGLGCNYGCSYCSQASQVGEATLSKTADVQSFLRDLDVWLERPPSRVEFWGGEPLLYFAKLRALVPELDRRFPDSGFSMISNGSLLNEEIAEFILDWDIEIAISHDGPGQHVRGSDPFDNPECLHWIRHLWNALGPRHRMAFNAVLTPRNCDPVAIRQWFVDRIGDPEVTVSLEGVVSTYDAKTRNGIGAWTEEQYAQMHRDIVAAFASGEAFQIPALRDKAIDFMESLATRRPSSALGQKCGMDREDQLAVDLQSNVLTCQNVGAKGLHRIGSALAMNDVALTTSMHWSNRRSCRTCPVLQLCRGACMYLDGDDFSQSCENEFALNSAILVGVLEHAAPLHIEPISRTRGRGTIPVIAAPQAFGLARVDFQPARVNVT